MTETTIVTKEYLDLAGLQVYDGLIKGVISGGDAKALKSFQFEKSTRTLKFYKTETPWCYS